MLLAMDVGNSSISCGVFDLHNWDTDYLPVCRFKISSQSLSADEYKLLFLQFLQLYGIRSASEVHSSKQDVCIVPELDACVISSVVPSLTNKMLQVGKFLAGCNPLLIGQGVRTGFGLRIKNPEQLGADIVSNVAGALKLSVPPFAVLDVGTATTITFVNNMRDLIGTVILPGIMVSMEALSNAAALLNDVSLEKPEDILGKNTSESVRSGVIGGHAYAVDGFIRNIREQYCIEGDRLNLIASGGLADCVLPWCRNKFLYVEDLTLIGAACLYTHQRIK